MFKKAITTVLVLGMSSFVSAGDDTRQISEESEVFVGVEIGGTMVQGDIDKSGTPLYDPNHSATGASIGIRLGAQNMQWRSMVMIDYFSKDVQTYERALIQVDYFVSPSNFSTTAFRPYIGINGGYINYEGGTADENGFTYGGQAGFTASVTQDIDFDLAYRYSVTTFDELDHIGNVAFGINYLY
ncbi:MAG: porin family protein [Sulfurovum sp.]|nr:porin family protein [Sulfurovum sp.]